MKIKNFAVQTTGKKHDTKKSDVELGGRNKMNRPSSQNYSFFRIAMSFVSAGLLCSGLLACQPQKGTEQVNIQPAVPVAPQGTGDSSGGNGLKNRVFERYSQDITKTQPWIQYIAPIEEHLKTVANDKNGDFRELFSDLAKYLQWYILPVKLKEIPKERLGVAMFQDPIQQLALQSLHREVWIDEEKFNDPEISDLDRATLFMHEKMVGLYLVRFLSLGDAVRLFNEMPGDENSELFVRLLDGHLKPEPVRDLTDTDYANIRAMTDFMMKDAIKVSSPEEIGIALYRYQFDPRFFGPNALIKKAVKELSPTPIEPSTREVSNLNLLNRLEAAAVVGQWPSTCRIDEQSIAKPADCGARLEMKRSAKHGISVKLLFDVSGPGGNQTIAFHRIFHNEMLTGPGTSIKTSTVMEWKRPLSDGSGVYQFFGEMGVPVNPMTNRQELVVKGRVYDLSIVWDENMTRVLDFILTESTVTKILDIRSDYSSGIEKGENVTFAWTATPEEIRRNILLTSDKQPLPKVRSRSFSQYSDSQWLKINMDLSPDFK